jgi:hypothetical protein
MANNGRSNNREVAMPGLVSPQGAPVTSGNWEAPRGSTPYFGFMDDAGGFNTIAIESIGMVASTNNGKFLVVTKGGQQMTLPATEGFNLMKRLGWSDRSARKDM